MRLRGRTSAGQACRTENSIKNTAGCRQRFKGLVETDFELLKVYQRNLEKSMVSADFIWYLETLLSKEADASLDCP